ncbi:hypothetical protein [Methylibium sp.]|uniref:hypothetical protein n=1 Tax=Methylibium sp. TaxID=2067992 RepID=UPI001811635B|nr:hypothetical protein [Methylibium sp.]MBA3588734.1 hypothetical protein [Methylibium sp.]
MLALRYVVLLLLGAAVVCFALSITTGDVRWRRRGLVIFKWTVIAGLVFFGVLIVERLRE